MSQFGRLGFGKGLKELPQHQRHPDYERKRDASITKRSFEELASQIATLQDEVDALQAAGDLMVFPGFTRQDLAASLTASILARFGETATGAGALPAVVSRAGSIVGLSVAGNAARSAGTATFEVYKNGSGTGLTVVIDGTNTQDNASTQAVGADTFVAKDRLDVRVTTDGSWAPATAEWSASIEVSYA